MQLLFSDAVIVIFLSAVPKFFLFHISKRVMRSPMRTTIDLPKEVMELVYRQALHRLTARARIRARARAWAGLGLGLGSWSSSTGRR